MRKERAVQIEQEQYYFICDVCLEEIEVVQKWTTCTFKNGMSIGFAGLVVPDFHVHKKDCLPEMQRRIEACRTKSDNEK